MLDDNNRPKPWGKWLAIVSIILITISLISFTNSMAGIEDLLDPEINNSGIIEPDSNKVISLESGRIYTMLRVVEDIGNEALLDVEITNEKGENIPIEKPTWLQPQRTGSNGTIIYDPVGTITISNSGNCHFWNTNSSSILYLIDDQEVDIEAIQQPGILIAFASCCLGLLILPISLIIHLLIKKQTVETNVLITQGLPSNRIPTTDELFQIREGTLNPQEVRGVTSSQSIPPPFVTNTYEKPKNTIQNIEIKDSNDTVENKENDDWQSWDSG